MAAPAQKRSKRLSVPLTSGLEDRIPILAEAIGPGISNSNVATMAVSIGVQLLESIFCDEPLPAGLRGRVEIHVPIPAGRGRPAKEPEPEPDGPLQRRSRELAQQIEVQGQPAPRTRLQPVERAPRPDLETAPEPACVDEGGPLLPESPPEVVGSAEPPSANVEPMITGSAEPPPAAPDVDDEVPSSVCPGCGAEVPDYDGFGVLAHLGDGGCGYCQHASITDGVCSFCDAVVRPADVPEPEAPPAPEQSLKDRLAELLEAGVPIERAYQQAREELGEGATVTQLFETEPTVEDVDHFSCVHGVRFDAPQPCEACVADGF